MFRCCIIPYNSMKGSSMARVGHDLARLLGHLKILSPRRRLPMFTAVSPGVSVITCTRFPSCFMFPSPWVAFGSFLLSVSSSHTEKSLKGLKIFVTDQRNRVFLRRLPTGLNLCNDNSRLLC